MDKSEPAGDLDWQDCSLLYSYISCIMLPEAGPGRFLFSERSA